MPKIIFTNYFHANKLIEGYPDYIVCAISNGIPTHDKVPNLKHIVKLSFFVPEWREVKNLKDGGAWSDFENAFMQKLKKDSTEITKWINEIIITDNTYVLCCWENTSGVAKCHRQILFNWLSMNKKLANLISIEYRHGNERV